MSKSTDKSLIRKWKEALRVSHLMHAEGSHLPERHEIHATANSLLAGNHVQDPGPGKTAAGIDRAGDSASRELLQSAYDNDQGGDY